MARTISLPTARVTLKGAKALRRGHPWLYRTELMEAPETQERGAVVSVVDPQGNPIGQAFYAQRSPLAIRLLTRKGPAEEKVELILNTEGRVLASLMGLSVDGRTAALLCGRTYRSPMLIQNIARWSAAPPALIAHLLKQEAVRRQPQLRMLLQRHPNAPADTRRGG